MKKRILAERRAWVEVARRMATDNVNEGTYGLCFIVDELLDEEKISSELHDSMHVRIQENMLADWTRKDGSPRELWDPPRAGGFAFYHDEREVRVLAALNLAVQAAQEGF